MAIRAARNAVARDIFPGYLEAEYALSATEENGFQFMKNATYADVCNGSGKVEEVIEVPVYKPKPF
jgi:hypothetical protein